MKQPVELQINKGIPNLRRRKPVWSTFQQGSWEVVTDQEDCPWGEESLVYEPQQNAIVLKEVATKVSSSTDEKSPPMPRKGGPRDGRGPGGQGFGGNRNYGPNDNNAKQ